VLAKIGRLGVRWSRPLQGTPRTVPITREADGWYVAISCAEVPLPVPLPVPLQPLLLTGEQAAIDLGLERFATRADGSQIPTPRLFGVAQRNRKRAQRRVSRRKKGSQRRRKAVVLLARAQQRVRRARADCPHKTALALVRQYDTVSHEDLPPANLVRNHHLAKSSSEAGWSAFLSLLACKAADAGTTVVAVPAAYTAQACSGCAVIVSKGLSVRWHACPACGTSRQRDHNAALNILRLGQEQRRAGQARQAVTWPVGASVA
jgi:putative transposase